MSEDQKQDTEQPTPDPTDRELRMDEMDDVSGGAIVVHDRRPNEENDK
jgi:hypothetical protein